MNVIETKNITKHYSRGKIHALEDVTLNVSEGTIFSLLGPNGAGKTTLIKLLLGIVFPTAGSATLLQLPIGDAAAHQALGYLAENHRFPDFLTARQTLYYYGKMSGVDAATLRQRIPELLKRVNLAGWEDTKIRKYSKGMMQRMGIAQALINNPKLLFLDEPTDGIDPVGRREIRDLLSQLRERGKTIFLNSHLLSEVERISDEVAILKNGRLIRQGTVAEFISVDRQYQLMIDGDIDLAEQICRRLDVGFVTLENQWVITVKDDMHLNHLIDSLRQEDVHILGIVPRRISLEDFFIDVVEDKQGAIA